MCGPLVEMLPIKVTQAQSLPWYTLELAALYVTLYFNLDYFQTTTVKGNYPLLALVFPQL